MRTLYYNGRIWTMDAAISRAEAWPGSVSWHPEERLTVEQALHGFTVGAAYASGEEVWKGSLSAGKLADFVVLSRDISAGDEESLGTVRPHATVVGGKVVFGDL